MLKKNNYSLKFLQIKTRKANLKINFTANINIGDYIKILEFKKKTDKKKICNLKKKVVFNQNINIIEIDFFLKKNNIFIKKLKILLEDILDKEKWFFINNDRKLYFEILITLKKKKSENNFQFEKCLFFKKIVFENKIDFKGIFFKIKNSIKTLMIDSENYIQKRNVIFFKEIKIELILEEEIIFKFEIQNNKKKKYLNNKNFKEDLEINDI